MLEGLEVFFDPRGWVVFLVLLVLIGGGMWGFTISL